MFHFLPISYDFVAVRQFLNRLLTFLGSAATYLRCASENMTTDFVGNFILVSIVKDLENQLRVGDL